MAVTTTDGKYGVEGYYPKPKDWPNRRWEEWQQYYQGNVSVDNPYGEPGELTPEEWKKQYVGDFDDVKTKTSKAKFGNSRSGEKGTAQSSGNKFLPFIVDSSTPKHIYKTLLSRSKGMNNVLIASVFNLTLNVNIKSLRDHVKALPDMPLEGLYEELLQKYGQYRIDEECLAYFRNLAEYVTAGQVEPWTEELQEFTPKDAMAFFCVVSIKGDKENTYSKFNFSGLHDISKS